MLADIKHRIEEIHYYQIDPDYIEQNLVYLEDSSGRNNLRIDGILATSGET